MSIFGTLNPFAYHMSPPNQQTNVHFQFPPITSPDDALQLRPPINYIPQEPDNALPFTAPINSVPAQSNNALPWGHFDDIPMNDYIPIQPSMF